MQQQNRLETRICSGGEDVPFKLDAIYALAFILQCLGSFSPPILLACICRTARKGAYRRSYLDRLITAIAIPRASAK